MMIIIIMWTYFSTKPYFHCVRRTTSRSTIYCVILRATDSRESAREHRSSSSGNDEWCHPAAKRQSYLTLSSVHCTANNIRCRRLRRCNVRYKVDITFRRAVDFQVDNRRLGALVCVYTHCTYQLGARPVRVASVVRVCGAGWNFLMRMKTIISWSERERERLEEESRSGTDDTPTNPRALGAALSCCRHCVSSG